MIFCLQQRYKMKLAIITIEYVVLVDIDDSKYFFDNQMPNEISRDVATPWELI